MAKTTPKKIANTTKKAMESLGVYQDEYKPVIERYAELRYSYDIMNTNWINDGAHVTEPYTNKAGATNIRKTAMYQVLENMRKELLDLENVLGLTPKSFRNLSKPIDPPPKDERTPFMQALDSWKAEK